MFSASATTMVTVNVLNGVDQTAMESITKRDCSKVGLIMVRNCYGLSKDLVQDIVMSESVKTKYSSWECLTQSGFCTHLISNGNSSGKKATVLNGMKTIQGRDQLRQ